MKKYLIFSIAIASSLAFSCGEKSDNTYDGNMEDHNEMRGAGHESDTNMVKRDGTLLSGAMDQADSVQLPSPVLEGIAMDDAISVDQITSKRMFEEKGITYYEVTFMTAGEQSLTMIYDEDGKIKSDD
ncbi:hypothetical protein SYJ56_09340 [Algoriphagus sp. D3-2-R+10]|uniref:hypothetical protein n=1 Tax=Algoriphagus aurantiacus TaxID=3103948 RepID=UPI002B367EF9|nr:hypothetical protein [Algoriphagus sp. D3-2-R+10]MEB2775512.1 hypothetical protein [Algoriphagus sp. D3-2-R+10]